MRCKSLRSVCARREPQRGDCPRIGACLFTLAAPLARRARLLERQGLVWPRNPDRLAKHASSVFQLVSLRAAEKKRALLQRARARRQRFRLRVRQISTCCAGTTEAGMPPHAAAPAALQARAAAPSEPLRRGAGMQPAPRAGVARRALPQIRQQCAACVRQRPPQPPARPRSQAPRRVRSALATAWRARASARTRCVLQAKWREALSALGINNAALRSAAPQGAPEMPLAR